MHARPIHRAALAAATALLLSASGAIADTVPADGDDVTPGQQDFFEVGPIGTGGTYVAQVWFDLECNTYGHIDVGQTVALDLGVPTVPVGGAVSGTGTTVGPAPTGWPTDGVICPTGTAPLRSATPAVVKLTAPGTPGVYDYIVNFTRTLEPAGNEDPAATRGLTRVFYELTVIADDPPTLVLPGSLTVEGNVTAGAVVTYAVGATDPEDATPPVPVCTPPSGTVFPLGSVGVTCTAADGGGHEVSGSFTVTVVDTTPPSLVGMPGSMTVTTDDPSGAVLSYTLPTASDIVDATPTVGCLPAPGDLVPVGVASVTCTATDASHNSATGSFEVTVDHVSPAPAPSTGLVAVFDPPIGPRNVVGGAPGRTVPVKVSLERDGARIMRGDVRLVLTTCGGETLGAPQVMRARGDRWTLGLDTTGLTGCVRATVLIDGQAAGGFDLWPGIPAAARRG